MSTIRMMTYDVQEMVSKHYGETISYISIFITGDHTMVLKNFPSSMLERVLQSFIQKDISIHCFYIEKDHGLNIYMDKYYLDNPSHFSATDGKPLVTGGRLELDKRLDEEEKKDMERREKK